MIASIVLSFIGTPINVSNEQNFSVFIQKEKSKAIFHQVHVKCEGQVFFVTVKYPKVRVQALSCGQIDVTLL